MCERVRERGAVRSSEEANAVSDQVSYDKLRERCSHDAAADVDLRHTYATLQQQLLSFHIRRSSDVFLQISI